MGFIMSQNLESAVLYFTCTSFLLATLFYWVGLFTGNKISSRYGLKLVVAGLLGNTCAVLLRFYAVGSMFMIDNSDFMLTYAWFTVVTGMLVIWHFKLNVAGIGVATIAFGLFVYVLATVEPVRVYQDPALYRSNWLWGYLFTEAMAYGIFAVAFGIGTLYLLKEYTAKTNPRGILAQGLPALEILEELIYQIISCGFPVFSVSIALGALWANNMQGQFWAWTPKETWSFISWFAYAAYFHSRRLHGWRGARSAWMAVMSFVAIIFTFFGVSYFLPGQI